MDFGLLAFTVVSTICLFGWYCYEKKQSIKRILGCIVCILASVIGIHIFDDLTQTEMLLIILCIVLAQREEDEEEQAEKIAELVKTKLQQ